ncbi:MAG: ATP-binding cassette domain-containing protein [candidate division Zixibacteria bacterium]|nr:ATP-binding cassette domain-containing protein [candidate division Zixibacteria bacterium]
MIQAIDIHKSFGDLKVLNGAGMEVGAGEVNVLLGYSGSGKSTFIRCLNGLEIIDSGMITIDGVPLDGDRKNIARIRSETGMVFQHYNLFPHLNVLKNLTLAQKIVRGRSDREAVDFAMEYLDKVGLSGKAKAYPQELSGGQAQRVAIARALCMMPKIMLFDEPTSALDPVMTAEVLSVIRKLAEEGMTMIIISHELDFALDVASNMCFMHDGRIIECSPPEQFLSSPETSIVREFLRSFTA